MTRLIKKAARTAQLASPVGGDTAAVESAVATTEQPEVVKRVWVCMLQLYIGSIKKILNHHLQRELSYNNTFQLCKINVEGFVCRFGK